MESYDSIHKTALLKLIEIVQEFRNIHPKMELNQVLVFLSVALQDGIEAHEIAKKFKILKSTTSANVNALSPIGYRKNSKGELIAGHGLIVQEVSPRDARFKELYLTLNGKKLTDRLTQILMQ